MDVEEFSMLVGSGKAYNVQATSFLLWQYPDNLSAYRQNT
jgi:hypothetical protein